ncbi:MAG: recombination protein RecR [Ruminococcaceae bacterium]|nr:recombination protein RecR [Oscillospiraceae bacterium]
MLYSNSLSKLIDMFKKMPGIGHKSAIRLAFNIISMSNEEVNEVLDTIKNAKEKISYCSICQNLTENDPCDICANEKRDQSTICVMESPKDVIALEKTREYFGLYHVLHGSISPMDDVTPDMLKIKELILRLKDDKIKEVILATNPSIEGEATAMYLARLIKPMGIKVSRIALGIPVGGDLEYADDVTITKAMELRHEL